MALPTAASLTDPALYKAGSASPHVRVPAKGSLASIGLPPLVTHIERHGLSAELVVSSGAATKSVHFEKGVIVFAKSNLIRDRLGNCLLQTGKISKEQFKIIDERMRLGGIRFGEALVAAGWMSSHEVIRNVGSQLGKIVLSLFPLQEGEYVMEERAPRVPPELKVKLFTGQLLLFGVRRIPANALMRSRLPGRETPLRCVSPPPAFLKLTKLQPLEQAIVDAMQQGANLRSLEESLSEDPRDILRAVYGLLVSGILTPFDRRSRVFSGARPTELQEKTEASNQSTSSSSGGLAAHPPAELATAPEPGPVTKRESSPSSAPSPPSTSKQNDDTAGRERQLLETVELHIAVNDWRPSVPLLTELLEIAPQNARYNALLACALGRCKGLEKHAERQFQRALHYAPQSADLYCEFGRFYVAMGRAGRGTQQFQEALRLDPNHSGARQANQKLRKAQSSLGSMFKKMLR
ncbi:MAG: DUF4388 domain-containing protein [Vicinamibacteria bacterium]